MNHRKLYFFSLLGVLAIILIVIVLVQHGNTLRTDQSAETKPNAAFADWSKVTPGSDLFTARFPTAPQEINNHIPIPKSNFSIQQNIQAALDAAGSKYFVVTFYYPQPFAIKDPHLVLKTAFDTMVAGISGSSVIASNDTDFKGLPSLEFTIQDGEQNFHRGRMLFSDRVLYQIFVTYQKNTLDDPAYQYFLNSFEPKPI